MPQFNYTAQTEAGARVSGQVGAATRRDALSTLIDRKLTPVDLRQDAESQTRRRVRSAAIESFYEMLADLLASGMPLSQAMDVVAKRTTDRALKSIVQSVRSDVVDGDTLTQALQNHADVFSPLALSLVHAGEQGGFLEKSLTELAELTRRQHELRSRVVGALAYPAFLLGVGVLVMVGMLIFFVPRFEPLFARLRANGELPWATASLLQLSQWLQGYWVVLLGFVVGAASIVLMVTDPEKRRHYWQQLQLRAPVAGPVMLNLAIARFCRLMGAMLSGGVPIVQSLQIARHSLGNQLLADAVLESSRNIEAGQSLTEPLKKSGLFPLEITEMISVGEQSNRLETVLLGIADKVEAKTQRRIDSLVKLLEPAMMVVMAILVGFLIVALLLPVFNSSGRF